MASVEISRWLGVILVISIASSMACCQTQTELRDSRFEFANEPNAIRTLQVTPRQWTKAKRRLIVFATPNGNTIEQSYGAQARPGLDWHFDIQHIGAQFRYIQAQTTEVDSALLIVQAGQLSWPAWRQATDGADRQIRRLIEATQQRLAADEVYLACHSGGGSFIWGWINAHEQLPSNLKRIALLDANYSYSDELRHGDKLLAWLRGNEDARLFVMAYDDRRVQLNGKNVVSADGGTWRASQRMMARFDKDETSRQDKSGPLELVEYLGTRARFVLHTNPDNKILHTALVGELNGFAAACLDNESSAWASLHSGTRCYTEFVEAQTLNDPNRPQARSLPDAHGLMLQLPERAASAETGSAFIARIKDLDRSARERAIVGEVLAGNVPTWARRLVPVEITVGAAPSIAESNRHANAGPADALKATGYSPEEGTAQQRLRLFVAQDYLAIGSDDDAVRMPMTPATAWLLAEKLNCAWPTAKVCDCIVAAADVRLNPVPMTKDRDQVPTFLEHHERIEKQLQGKGRDGLIVGQKKDLIFTTQLLKQPHRVAIYGWHYPSGVPIQPVYVGHVDWYTDYSHGLRLIANRAEVDGEVLDYRELLRSERGPWLSYEGPIDVNQLRSYSQW